MAADALTAGAKASDDVSALLRARNSLIWVVTREEARAERLLADAAAKAGYEPRFWDCATGVTNLTGDQAQPGGDYAKDPATLLQTIRDSKLRQVWVLRDLPVWFRDPTVLRGTRSLARMLASVPRDEARALIVLTPDGEVPPELAGHAIVVEWPLPDRAEVEAILTSVISALPDDLQATAAPNGTREAAVDAAVGLTAEEAQSCYAKSLVQSRRIDPKVVSAEKRRVIARERVLEWYDPIPGGLDSVGGLDVLKGWLAQRKSAFSAKARAYGLPPPKGCLLVGVPGCGKSLTAKAIGTAWGIPILRLDLGGLKSKYVGESEGNLRKALRVAEAVSPCVVWLDEIEKAMAGATQGAADGGVSSDALGTILSWMQERQGSVFVVATANDVTSLPPELMRKGRFDETFWVDLPTAAERGAIVEATLRQYGRKLSPVEVGLVQGATVGFTGAELAALVPEALYAAFADGERELRGDDLAFAAAATVPMSKSSAEKIEKLRTWAKGRARPASTPEAQAPLQGGRRLDIA